LELRLTSKKQTRDGDDSAAHRPCEHVGHHLLVRPFPQIASQRDNRRRLMCLGRRDAKGRRVVMAGPQALRVFIDSDLFEALLVAVARGRWVTLLSVVSTRTGRKKGEAECEAAIPHGLAAWQRPHRATAARTGLLVTFQNETRVKSFGHVGEQARVIARYNANAVRQPRCATRAPTTARRRH
jgi:hypothetical protein